MSDVQYVPTPIESEAIALINRSKNEWEDAVTFVTDRVAFQNKNLIRILRKNYYGIFDSPIDPTTNRKKIWIPLTESTVEAVVKNIDLDQKDINFRAKHPNGYATTSLVRSVVRDYLSRQYFGETLDDFERRLAIDGTAVLKTWKGYKSGKPCLETRIVDVLNFYIDPTARSIAETPYVIERAIISRADVSSYSDWTNTEFIHYQTNLEPNDGSRQLSGVNMHGESPMVDVYELWGLIPKYWVTGKKVDFKSGEVIEGQAIVSGLDNGTPIVHKIARNPKGVKPYEECWYTRVPGRWYGRGIAEKVMMLQIWANTIANIRINRSYVTQLGLFKIRSGSGITPQILSRLGANGAIPVQSMDDIEQFPVQDIPSSSYMDENVIQGWTQRVTSAYDAATGESMAASTPATNAVIQERNAKSQFTLVQEALGFFLERWMDRQALPIIIDIVSKEELLRYAKDDESFDEVIERVVGYYANEQVNFLLENGQIPDPAQVAQVLKAAKQRLQSSDIFFKLLDKILTSQIDTEVYVTTQELDPAVMITNLQNILQVSPEFKVPIIKMMLDLMGLPQPKLAPPPMPVDPGQIQARQKSPASAEELMRSANTSTGDLSQLATIQGDRADLGVPAPY